MHDTLDTADLRDFLHAHIQVLIAEANEAGFGTEEILAELRDIIEQQRIAYDADPDPAEDPGQAADARSPHHADTLDAEEEAPRAG
jgi:hypothetical protein